MQNTDSVMDRLEKLVSRLEQFECRVTASAVATDIHASTGAPVGSGSDIVTAYDEILSRQVEHVVDTAKAVSDAVLEVSEALKRAFVEERRIVYAMAHCKKPSDNEMQALLAPVAREIDAVQAKASGRRTKEEMHLKLAAEAMGALSWVCCPPGAGAGAPPRHVEEAQQGALFYGNKILMEHRRTGPEHVAWVKAVQELFDALKAYAKEFHKSGPSWNAGGVPLAELGEAPAPPAAPPAAKAPAGRAPAAGAPDAVPAKPPAAKAPAAGPPDAAPAKPPAAKAPVLELRDRRRWVVENHDGDGGLVVEAGDPKQSVYVYGCRGCTLQVRGKVNAITVDKCERTGVVFESAVASCEAVNCRAVQLQVTGHCGTFAVDKCDGLRLFLSRESTGADIVTAKSSEVIIVAPGATDEDDMVEQPVPEQFVSRLEGGRLVTAPASHSAA
uniref:Adenylyl cyclase-associated protein n=1 Tax=Tetraselmis sp. GSL018 TaxID=582737 RepID=A0A061RIX5_9CHLO|eukprot:CAMPEP_0177584732 /NCGR_PEP_ID=MMETSP0419_2-20121207/4070_1 /TAXON_ID=582737 /ORGANISM="Tetraselmis sp., Strain GSL018" /LENGTH=442 /DNA_ID=CAMNT_0019074325 /DNA_START=203 /DNA_END=1531 /DNA_ORIENTATION=+